MESRCHGGAAGLHRGQKAGHGDRGGQCEKKPENKDLDEVGPRIQKKLVGVGHHLIHCLQRKKLWKTIASGFQALCLFFL